MLAGKTITKNAVAVFWENYLAVLRKRGVKETVGRWYVRRAEEFIRVAKGKKIQDHRAADINRYLEDQGRKDRITDWQFLQIVDVICHHKFVSR